MNVFEVGLRPEPAPNASILSISHSIGVGVEWDEGISALDLICRASLPNCCFSIVLRDSPNDEQRNKSCSCGWTRKCRSFSIICLHRLACFNLVCERFKLYKRFNNLSWNFYIFIVSLPLRLFWHFSSKKDMALCQCSQNPYRVKEEKPLKIFPERKTIIFNIIYYFQNYLKYYSLKLKITILFFRNFSVSAYNITLIVNIEKSIF